MLPRERRPGAHIEGAPPPPEPPEDGAGPPVDLVDRVCVACRDEQIAVTAELDRVDVEVVERRFPSPLRVGLRECDAAEGVPLEQHPSRRDVELLETRIDHVAPTLVEGDQGRVPRRDRELVLVARETVAGAEESDSPVGAVQDHVVTAPAAELRMSLPPGQHGPAAVTLHAEIGHS